MLLILLLNTCSAHFSVFSPIYWQLQKIHLVKAGTNTRKPQSLDAFSIRGENSQCGSLYFVSNYMFQMKRLGLCTLPRLSSWQTVQTALCFWIGYVPTWKKTEYRNWPVNHVVYWKGIGLWVLSDNAGQLFGDRESLISEPPSFWTLTTRHYYNSISDPFFFFLFCVCHFLLTIKCIFLVFCIIRISYLFCNMPYFVPLWPWRKHTYTCFK